MSTPINNGNFLLKLYDSYIQIPSIPSVNPDRLTYTTVTDINNATWFTVTNKKELSALGVKFITNGTSIYVNTSGTNTLDLAGWGWTCDGCISYVNNPGVSIVLIDNICPNKCSGGKCTVRGCVCDSSNFDHATGCKECISGQFGNDCSCSNKCLNSGTCSNGKCNCPDGWTGSTCQTKQGNIPCPNNCSNNGTCDSNTGKCKCNIGYNGVNCVKKDSIIFYIILGILGFLLLVGIVGLIVYHNRKL